VIDGRSSDVYKVQGRRRQFMASLERQDWRSWELDKDSSGRPSKTFGVDRHDRTLYKCRVDVSFVYEDIANSVVRRYLAAENPLCSIMCGRGSIFVAGGENPYTFGFFRIGGDPSHA